MGKTTCIFAALAMGVLASAVAGIDRPLPSDPRIQTGKLDNGVTWFYRQHDNPPGKMALMIHVRTGSLNEKDSQRGLAHFLEHMCFNGTENFPPGALIPYFESIGMEFGADLNASTNFDSTRYMLFTPNTEEAQIDKALMVLSDYAFRATLNAEEIDKERGVVLEEARRGKSAQQRVRDKLWPELFEGSRFAQRLPIGDEKVLATAPRSEFVDYYRTWYRPENVAVFAVGDAPAERVTPLIRKWFGTFKAEGDASPPLKAEFKPFSTERTLVVTDPELTECRVQMMNLKPGRPPADNVDAWRTQLVEGVAAWILGRRYDERRRKAEAHYRSAFASVSDFFHEAVTVTAQAVGEPKDWAVMLEEVIEEVNRAAAYGFTQQELELARREFLAEARRAVRIEGTLNARNVISRLVQAHNDRVPALSAQQELDLYDELLSAILLEEVNRVFHERFAPGTFAFVITTPEKTGVTVPSREEALSAAQAALKLKPQPRTQGDSPTALLEALPEPGKIAETTKDKELGITHLWLENGVRVHHRYMDYKEDTIALTISLAGGQIEETAKTRGLSDAAALVVNDAATSRLTSTHIRDIIVGKQIRVFVDNGVDDALMIRINGSPRDLENGLQLAYALLTDGKLEDQSLADWRLRTLQRIESLSKQPSFAASQAVAEFTGGGDTRAKFLTRSQVEALDAPEAQAYFDKLCREAPIEVSIVGKASLEEVQPLVLRYLGSLPRRERKTDKLDALRRWKRKPGPLTERIEVRTITPQAFAMVGFIGCDGKNVEHDRALQLADKIVSSWLVKRVREELALVYSIGINSNPSWDYEDSGRFSAGATCDPAHAEEVAKQIRAIYTEFAELGPTEEELENAKRQIAENLDTAMREPQWWSDVLDQLDFHGRKLDDEKKHKEAFEKITADEVKAAFKKYYTPERTYEVTAIPVKPPEEKKAEDAPSATPPAAPTP